MHSYEFVHYRFQPLSCPGFRHLVAKISTIHETASKYLTCLHLYWITILNPNLDTLYLQLTKIIKFVVDKFLNEINI